MIRGLVCALLLMSVLPVNADFITYTGIGPNYRGYQPQLNRNNTINYRNYNRPFRQYRTQCNHPNCNYAMYRNGLSALEKYALKKNYGGESELNRLERLEMLAFGAVQNGDVGERFSNVESAILSRPQYDGQKKSFLNKLGNYFLGEATGTTPTLMPGLSPAYMQGYGPFGGYNFMQPQGFSNSTVESYSNGLFGSGYSITGNDYGGGSSVKILD